MRVTKYKNAKGYKIQILSDYSLFSVNGGSESATEYWIDKLVEEAKKQIKKHNAEYYVIESYLERNYGIVGINLRVFDTQELKDDYVSKHKDQILEY